MHFLLLTVSLAFSAPATLPAHRLAVTNDGRLALPEATFAVVGNTRPVSPGLDRARTVEGSHSEDVIGDIIAQGLLGTLDFVVHTGDMVTHSSTPNWRSFAEQFSSLLDGSTAAATASKRVPIVPVAGDRDCVKQPDCTTFSKVFPGFGNNIGYGRASTWQSFELAIGDGPPWKVLVLDSNKKALGSRWNEQNSWLREQAKNPQRGLLVFIHEPPVSILESKGSQYSSELIEIIETNAPLMSIKAVFSAGPSMTQALMPGGAFGTAHFAGGGGGTPAVDFPIGLNGSKIDQMLAPGFSDGLDQLVRTYAALESAPPERLVEEALGKGSFEGYARRISGADFPTHGWWKVEAVQDKLSVTWRCRQPDGTFQNQSAWMWTAADGWEASNGKQ